MKETRNTREIINECYPEFPETIINAELCRAMARIEGRSIKQALKAYAQARIPKVESKPLKRRTGADGCQPVPRD